MTEQVKLFRMHQRVDDDINHFIVANSATIVDIDGTVADGFVLLRYIPGDKVDDSALA